MFKDNPHLGNIKSKQLNKALKRSGNNMTKGDIDDPIGLGDIHGTEKGSGARFNTGKLPWGLLPLEAMEDCIRVFEYGASKYAIGNWERGMSWKAVYESLMRHMCAWQAGEENDPETGLPHLGHAMCNMIMLSRYKTTYPEGDDRVTTVLKQQQETLAEEDIKNAK